MVDSIHEASGKVFFWGRSMSGEFGYKGYVKYIQPTHCELLSGHSISKVLASKSCTVCLKSNET